MPLFYPSMLKPLVDRFFPTFILSNQAIIGMTASARALYQPALVLRSVMLVNKPVPYFALTGYPFSFLLV